jgi:hypothetical protein
MPIDPKPSIGGSEPLEECIERWMANAPEQHRNDTDAAKVSNIQPYDSSKYYLHPF